MNNENEILNEKITSVEELLDEEGNPISNESLEELTNGLDEEEKEES